MKISDLEFQDFSDLLSQVSGGIVISNTKFSISNFKKLLGIGSYRAAFKAFAWGRKKAHTGGYAKGRIYKTRYGVVSVSSSHAYALAKG